MIRWSVVSVPDTAADGRSTWVSVVLMRCVQSGAWFSRVTKRRSLAASQRYPPDVRRTCGPLAADVHVSAAVGRCL